MNGKIIQDITDFIFVSDESEILERKNFDIIFIPGSSSSQLPEAAAELYNKKCAPIIMPTGKYGIKSGKMGNVQNKPEIYNKDYKTECEFYADVLIRNGVPESAILREDNSEYTQQNADFSRKVADDNNLKIKSAVVVCKSFHARRCLMYWQIAFPESEIKIFPAVRDCATERRDNWFKSEKGIGRVLGEIARVGTQFKAEDFLKIE